MKALIERIDIQIGKRSLLKHPFYQMWNDGELTIDHLRVTLKSIFIWSKQSLNLFEISIILQMILAFKVHLLEATTKKLTIVSHGSSSQTRSGFQDKNF